LQLLMALLPDVVVLVLPVGQLAQLIADALLYVPGPQIASPPVWSIAPLPAHA
jgi:hypothetical protein